MEIDFYKYQGTGNDFILIDGRSLPGRAGVIELIPALCDRRFGIGSDGVIFIGNHEEADFEMTFYNPDGSMSFCGNGSRCAVSFAASHGLIEGKTTRFVSNDGSHNAEILNDERIALQMSEVKDWEMVDNGIFLNTGSPHLVWFVEDLENFEVEEEGRRWRNNPRFAPGGGTNVNFVQRDEDRLRIRTYERGVEAETLSCGTGVTAAALAAALERDGNGNYFVSTEGGELEVSYQKQGDSFEEVYLIGPARAVFKGTFDTEDFDQGR